MAIISVIDVGNFSTKYAYEYKGKIIYNSFSSVIHPFKEMEETNEIDRYTFGSLDYYVGDAVKNFYSGKEHKMFFGNIKKGHHEAQIRLLAALYNIYKETNEREFNLILTSPYDSMNSDKDYFIKYFQGKKSSLVNNSPFEFEVKKIIMAAEGLGALNYSKTKNCVIVDAGSMTTNILYLINGVISKEDSITLNGGTINNSPFEIAQNIAKSCPYIEYNYPIICTGGKPEEINQSLAALGYENISVPVLEGEKQELFYINAVGLLLKYNSKFEGMFS